MRVSQAWTPKVAPAPESMRQKPTMANMPPRGPPAIMGIAMTAASTAKPRETLSHVGDRSRRRDRNTTSSKGSARTSRRMGPFNSYSTRTGVTTKVATPWMPLVFRVARTGSMHTVRRRRLKSRAQRGCFPPGAPGAGDRRARHPRTRTTRGPGGRGAGGACALGSWGRGPVGGPQPSAGRGSRSGSGRARRRWLARTR